MVIDNYLRLRRMPNRPETFYKYVTPRVAKIILVNRKLRWSSPILFNDPFDVQRDFDLGFDIDELKHPIVNEIANLINADGIPDLSSRPYAAYLVDRLRRKDYVDIRNAVMKDLPMLIGEGIKKVKNSSYQQLKRQWSEFIPQFRILCLSEVNDSLLMWSHYADSHKGVVLELQCIDHLDSPWLIAQPVKYQSVPPVLSRNAK